MTVHVNPLEEQVIKKQQNEKDQKQDLQLKGEHKKIYEAFLAELKKRKEVKGGKEVDIFTFIHERRNNIFNATSLENTNVISGENFCEFLLSVYEGIRTQSLTNKKSLGNDAIQEIVAQCVKDARGQDTKDTYIKLVGKLIGIEIDPRNIFASIKSGLMNKIPFFGGKQEETNPAKTDTEMVTSTLAKVLFSIALFVITALIFNVSTVMVAIGIIGITIAIGKAIKGLFQNDKPGTAYNTDSPQIEKQDWNKKITEGISSILNEQVQNPTEKTSEVIIPKNQESAQVASEKIAQTNHPSSNLSTDSISNHITNQLKCS